MIRDVLNLHQMVEDFCFLKVFQERPCASWWETVRWGFEWSRLCDSNWRIQSQNSRKYVGKNV